MPYPLTRLAQPLPARQALNNKPLQKLTL